jgi:hypothetical protein
MAARVFSELKERKYNAELVTEFAKDLTWQESMKVLDNQMYVFAKQYHRLWRLKDKVDIIVTDSPIILSLVYGNTSATFKQLVREEFQKFNNINIFLQRVKEYNPKGRAQTEEEARLIDGVIKYQMRDLFTFDLEVPGRRDSMDTIVAHIENIWKELPQSP